MEKVGFFEANRNTILTGLGLLVILVIGILIGALVFSGPGIDTKKYEQVVEKLETEIKHISQEKEVLRDSLDIFSRLAAEYKAKDTGLVLQTNKIRYETKKALAAVDSLPPDSAARLFSILAEEYIRNSR